jgi:enamine deaminase RidA (YjgF/YER057c/UK114 family)
MGQRTLVGTPNEFEAVFGFSRAVRAGNHVYVAGTAGRLPDGTWPGDVAGQARAAFATIESVLARAGASLRDVVLTRLYVTDMSTWQDVAAVHNALFREIRPVCTIAEVTALVHPDILIEIEVEAVITDAGPAQA